MQVLAKRSLQTRIICYLINRQREEEKANERWRALAAWFLGPKAENRVEFNNLVLAALNDYEDFRASYQPVDPLYINEDVKNSVAYQNEIRNLEDSTRQLNAMLRDSVPFFSPRYKVQDPVVSLAVFGSLSHCEQEFAQTACFL